MKAWEVMRGRAYAFDLVLTEVAMPSLSGIQLLARIVAADECKNIPVISKHDSNPNPWFPPRDCVSSIVVLWIESSFASGLGLACKWIRPR